MQPLRFGSRIRTARRKRASSAAAPHLEACESRALLAVFTVTTAADAIPSAIGQTSLRDAINLANASPGPDDIVFNIPGPGVQTINLTQSLPSIADPVSINGYSQPGASANTLDPGNNAVVLIEIDGRSLSAGGSGITIGTGASGSRVAGLAIGNFASGAGVLVSQVSDVTIEGNRIGVDAQTGSQRRPNRDGVTLDAAFNATIGGTTAAARNTISGNENGVVIQGFGDPADVSTDNVVAGNYIGTNPAGDSAIFNSSAGVLIQGAARNNTIGGADALARNVISGNRDGGAVFLGSLATTNTLLNNFVGLNASGTASISNFTAGVLVSDSPDNIIGPDNFVSGNSGPGLVIFGTSATNNLVVQSRFGLNANGDALANSGAGILIEDAPNNIIGSEFFNGNIISGNAEAGVLVRGASATGNQIIGNAIGSDFFGTRDLGNLQDGVKVTDASNTIIGGDPNSLANIIAFNSLNGVQISAAASGVTILSNQIMNNDLLGIEIATGSAAPAPPSITRADSGLGVGTTIEGTVSAAPNAAVIVQIFENQTADPSGSGEGETLLATVQVNTNSLGVATFSFTAASVIAPGRFVTATVTNPDGSTSEFSTARGISTVLPPQGSLSGFVFEDDNNNGVREAGEAGILNVTIRLTGTDSLGNSVNRITQTAANGSYSFPNLFPGTYQIAETQPFGFLDGKEQIGSLGGVLSGNDVIANITRSGTQNGVEYNFGELPPAEISGLVYRDLNNDGNQQTGETGIGNVSITLTGTDDLGQAVNLSTLTLNNGLFSFDNLRPGTYTLTETQPVGFFDGRERIGTGGGVNSANDVISNIALPVGGLADNYLFGELTQARISGAVYNDLNNDGLQQAGETGIPGVTVSLTGTDDRSQPVNRLTVTDSAGSFNFASLRPGSYTLTETQPAGFFDGKERVGTSGGVNSANDVISNILLNVGVNANGYLFGELPPGRISGFVYNDVNNDGAQQTGEAGISGVSVTLTGTDDLGQSVNRATVTANDGFYIFPNLRPGTYALAETQPSTFADGKETAGTLGGNVAVNDVISNIVLPVGGLADNYLFGETNLAPSFVVINTNDSGPGSLRQVLTDANNFPGRDRITFNIPGSGPFIISPGSALPFVNESAIIDATSQPGFNGSPIVVLNGASAGANVDGLRVVADRTEIRGFVIQQFAGCGIALVDADFGVIQGNWIGLSADGRSAAGNLLDGICVFNSAGNTIGVGTNEGSGSGGGSLALSRNVIAGNGLVGGIIPLSAIRSATPVVNNSVSASGIHVRGIGSRGNLIQGNFIGTNANGDAPLGNSAHGVFIGDLADSNRVADNLISANGGAVPGAGVFISARNNDETPIAFSSYAGNRVEANLIGTNAAGNAPLRGGQRVGVVIDDLPNNVVVNNTISGNDFMGVLIARSRASNNRVIGNRIGTDLTGRFALPNGVNTPEFGVVGDGVGINNAPNNTIGGTGAGEANLIAGNLRFGTNVFGADSIGNLFDGSFNRYGVNADGDPLPNGAGADDDIFINAAPTSVESANRTRKVEAQKAKAKAKLQAKAQKQKLQAVKAKLKHKPIRQAKLGGKP